MCFLLNRKGKSGLFSTAMIVLYSFLIVIFGILIFRLKKQVNPNGRFMDYVKHFGHVTQDYFQQVEVRHVEMAITGRDNKKSFRFAHLTDLHFDIDEHYNFPHFVQQQILENIKEKRPDYIFITGDFVHWDPNQAAVHVAKYFIRNVTQMMEQIHHESKTKSRRVFGTLGNHDLLLVGMKNQIIQNLEIHGGIQILNNDYIFLEEHDLVAIGLGDYMLDVFDPESVYERMKKDPRLDINSVTSIVLSHNPDSAECLLFNSKKTQLIPYHHVNAMKYENDVRDCSGLENFPVDIILSGHTHAGQVIIPWLQKPLFQIFYNAFPLDMFDRFIKIFGHRNVVKRWDWYWGFFLHDRQNIITDEDEHQQIMLQLVTSNRTSNFVPTYQIMIHENHNPSYLYVNKGVGGHMGIRLNCNPEISLFDVVSKEKSSN